VLLDLGKVLIAGRVHEIFCQTLCSVLNGTWLAEEIKRAEEERKQGIEEAVAEITAASLSRALGFRL
jgi:antirestriction protein ArdC